MRPVKNTGMKHSGIRGSLENYIYRNIVPQYAAFDPAHREDHAVAVIDNSLKLYDEAPKKSDPALIRKFFLPLPHVMILAGLTERKTITLTPER